MIIIDDTAAKGVLFYKVDGWKCVAGFRVNPSILYLYNKFARIDSNCDSA
jgi:hypothetical protein